MADFRSTRNGKPTIGAYGNKTRALQRRISYEAFGLSAKNASFYLYLGDNGSDNPSVFEFSDKVFFEIKDRKYSQTPIKVPIGVEPQSSMPTDFSRFGLINPLTSETTFRMHIDDTNKLGRYPIVGDVFGIDFFDTATGKAMWEITDVDASEPTLETFVITISATVLNSARSSKELPLNRTNEDMFSDIMEQADEQYNEFVPTTDINYDHSKVPVGTNVSYLNALPESFLDDPFATF